ncbi:hypothetical protein [Nitrosomonas sp. wSCUT-2]
MKSFYYFLLIFIGFNSSLVIAEPKFRCEEPLDSPFFCRFSIVDPEADFLLPASDRLAGDVYILKPQEVLEIKADLIGKYFCSDTPLWDGAPNDCYGKKEILDNLNVFGGIKPSKERYIPVDLRSDEITQCLLLSQRGLPIGEYLPMWLVTTETRGVFGNSDFLNDDVRDQTVEICKGRWVVQSKKNIFTSIEDFVPPTIGEYYLSLQGTKQKMQSLLEQLKILHEQKSILENGYVLHIEVKRKWYLVYAEASYEARVTKGMDRNSAPLIVEDLMAAIKIEGMVYKVECKNTWICSGRLQEGGLLFGSNRIGGFAKSTIKGLTNVAVTERW